MFEGMDLRRQFWLKTNFYQGKEVKCLWFDGFEFEAENFNIFWIWCFKFWSYGNGCCFELVYKACEFLKMAIANALVEIVPRVLIIFLLCNKIQRLENEVD